MKDKLFYLLIATATVIACLSASYGDAYLFNN